MPVHVERDLDRGVSEPLLDRLRMRPGGDRERGGAVPEVVPPQGRETGSFDRRSEHPASEVVTPQRCAGRRREDVPLAWVGRHVLCEHLDDVAG